MDERCGEFGELVQKRGHLSYVFWDLCFSCKAFKQVRMCLADQTTKRHRLRSCSSFQVPLVYKHDQSNAVLQNGCLWQSWCPKSIHPYSMKWDCVCWDSSKTQTGSRVSSVREASRSIERHLVRQMCPKHVGKRHGRKSETFMDMTI
jgi:hypothetical protein